MPEDSALTNSISIGASPIGEEQPIGTKKAKELELKRKQLESKNADNAKVMEDVRSQQQDIMEKLDIMVKLRMTKILRSLGWSTEAKEMCEVFKKHNFPQ